MTELCHIRFHCTACDARWVDRESFAVVVFDKPEEIAAFIKGLVKQTIEGTMERQIEFLMDRLEQANADHAAMMFFVGMLYQQEVKRQPQLLKLLGNIADGNAAMPIAPDAPPGITLTAEQKAEIEKGTERIKRSQIQMATMFLEWFGRK